MWAALTCVVNVSSLEAGYYSINYIGKYDKNADSTSTILDISFLTIPDIYLQDACSSIMN